MFASRMSSGVQKWVERHSQKLQLWGVGALGLCILFATIIETYHDNSYQLLVASYLQMCGFAFVGFSIKASGNASGASLRTMECYAIAITARFLSIGFYVHYMPGDHANEHRTYQLLELLTLGIVGWIVYLIRFVYKETYDGRLDTLKTLYLTLPTLALAAAYHPTANQDWYSDVAYAFSLYLEVCSVLPQLVLFTAMKEVRPFLSHFVMSIAVAKMLTFYCWAGFWSRYRLAFLGYITVSQGIQLLLMADFVYKYVQCIRKNVALPLLICHSV